MSYSGLKTPRPLKLAVSIPAHGINSRAIRWLGRNKYPPA